MLRSSRYCEASTLGAVPGLAGVVAVVGGGEVVAVPVAGVAVFAGAEAAVVGVGWLGCLRLGAAGPDTGVARRWPQATSRSTSTARHVAESGAGVSRRHITSVVSAVEGGCRHPLRCRGGRPHAESASTASKSKGRTRTIVRLTSPAYESWRRAGGARLACRQASRFPRR
jgi:hypothetical protein